MRSFTPWIVAAATAALLLADGTRAVAVAADKRQTTPGTYIVRLFRLCTSFHVTYQTLQGYVDGKSE